MRDFAFWLMALIALLMVGCVLVVPGFEGQHHATKVIP